MATTQLSGKELASLIGVSPAALSKAVKNKHFCTKLPVFDWAVLTESGRIAHFEVSEWPLMIICHSYTSNCRTKQENGGDKPTEAPLSPRMQALVENVTAPRPSVKPSFSVKSTPLRPRQPVQRTAKRPDLHYPTGGSTRDKVMWWAYSIGKAFVEHNEERRGSHG